MKTTVEISDELARSIRTLALEEGTTMRALIEAGLRRVLEEHTHRPPFRLRDAHFQGNGMRPEFRDSAWERIRREAYGVERGG